MSEPEQPDNQDFAQILDAYEQTEGGQRREDPKPGDKVSGKLLSIGDDAAFVDLGTKSEGVIATAELLDRDGKLGAAVGDTIEAMVAGHDPDSGALRLRRRAAGALPGNAIGDDLREAYTLKLPVEGVVSGFNKGGIEVKVGGIRGFCPLSQVDLRRIEDPATFVGQRLAFRITQLEEAGGARKRPNVVLSRRLLLEEDAAAKSAETIAKIQPGMIVRGKVTSLAGYGAFLDLGGVEGLLHVSEIGHARLAHPQDALTVGQELEVQVLKIEADEKKKGSRISLSRKALETDPWQEVAQRFTEGQELAGMVTRAETFGAFVSLAPGIEGLVHISELAHLAKGKRLNHGREAVKLGDEIQVKVLGVDAEKRRISLGIAGVDREAPIAPRPTTRPTERPQPRRDAAPAGARPKPEGRTGDRASARPAGGPEGRRDSRSGPGGGGRSDAAGRPGRSDRPSGPGGPREGRSDARRDSRPRPDARGPRPTGRPEDEGPLVDPGETTKSSPPQGSFGTLGDFFKKKGLA